MAIRMLVVLLVLMNGGAQQQRVKKNALTQEAIGSGKKAAAAIGAMPPAPNTHLLFKNSKDGQAQAAAVEKGAGAGGGKGGNDVGGKGGKKETPQQKKLRELEEENEEYEYQQKIKKLEKAKKSRGGGVAGEQDDDEDESVTPTELLELEVRSADKAYKYLQDDLADRESAGAPTEEAQRRVDETKEKLEERKQAVRESKDPQERLQQSSPKARRVQDAKNKLCESLKEEMAAKAETVDKLKHHQETIDELVTKIEAKKVDLDRLNKEAFTVQELVIGAESTGMDKLGERAGASILEKFDNPLLRNDSTVPSKGRMSMQLSRALPQPSKSLKQLESKSRRAWMWPKKLQPKKLREQPMRQRRRPMWLKKPARPRKWGERQLHHVHLSHGNLTQPQPYVTWSWKKLLRSPSMTEMKMNFSPQQRKGKYERPSQPQQQRQQQQVVLCVESALRCRGGEGAGYKYWLSLAPVFLAFLRLSLATCGGLVPVTVVVSMPNLCWTN